MDNEFGKNTVVLTDENGQEVELEHLDTMEYNGQLYMAFFPAIQGEEGEDGEIVDVDPDDEEYG